MTEWTTHIPRFDGDAPEGVGLDTHEVEVWTPSRNKWKPFHDWHKNRRYRYRIRYDIIMAELVTLRALVNSPACMEDVKG